MLWALYHLQWTGGHELSKSTGNAGARIGCVLVPLEDVGAHECCLGSPFSRDIGWCLPTWLSPSCSSGGRSISSSSCPISRTPGRRNLKKPEAEKSRVASYNLVLVMMYSSQHVVGISGCMHTM